MSKPASPQDVELLQRARQYALDLERQARIESSQGHLSPTDLALFSRVVSFLRWDIATHLTGDPEFGLSDNDQD